MFIQTEDTPNPATLKFLPGRDVVGDGHPAVDCVRGDNVAHAPLAEMLFMIPDVTRILLGSDYISVTKSDEADWKHLKPAILGAIMDFFVAGGTPFLADKKSPEEAGADERVYEGEVAEIVAQIKELIELRVRPAVEQDGGDIVFKHFSEEEGTVYLEMRGACAGCPSSSLTLKSGIENLLKHYVPEVNRVEQAL